jgi:16S rRNA (guanine527-N7)-methyltransferase
MVSRETPGPTPPLPDWLAEHAGQLTSFVGLLADAGVTRGLIGPREVPRLWERHILNCAVVADPAAELVLPGATIGDVGSGAGLPGLVWAIVRPDTRVLLIEPLLRRSTFLAEAVSALGVGDRVTVWRGRAEEAAAQSGFQPLDIVTARAVAPLERLVGWTVPLLAPGGRLVALKGSSATQELAAATAAATAAGLTDLEVREMGGGVVDPPTTVIIGVRRTAQ